ncbi:hypothetical protein MHBO_001248 [Bonamia ostreae]|uniref:Uncharacterized protein n=1 Tax=Bonamia ostreae TaxID=126728 RepID=A0ABV2AIC2_9EUKA
MTKGAKQRNFDLKKYESLTKKKNPFDSINRNSNKNGLRRNIGIISKMQHKNKTVKQFGRQNKNRYFNKTRRNRDENKQNVNYSNNNNSKFEKNPKTLMDKINKKIQDDESDENLVRMSDEKFSQIRNKLNFSGKPRIFKNDVSESFQNLLVSLSSESTATAIKKAQILTKDDSSSSSDLISNNDQDFPDDRENSKVDQDAETKFLDKMTNDEVRKLYEIDSSDPNDNSLDQNQKTGKKSKFASPRKKFATLTPSLSRFKKKPRIQKMARTKERNKLKSLRKKASEFRFEKRALEVKEETRRAERQKEIRKIIENE